jgi:hypothetical protein
VTTTPSTERLIGSLVADMRPVARLRPPMERALRFLAVVLALGGASILLFADRAMMREHAQHPEWFIELAGTLATGCLATIAAFHLSLPDRPARWALLPLPALAVWLAGSGAGCWRAWVTRGWDGSLQLGDSAHCLEFILGLGLPLGLALLLVLRRAKPLSPLPVAATGALGAAALSAFLLQFFHPFEVTVMDLAVHAFAVGVVVAVAGMSGRRVLA